MISNIKAGLLQPRTQTRHAANRAPKLLCRKTNSIMKNKSSSCLDTLKLDQVYIQMQGCGCCHHLPSSKYKCRGNADIQRTVQAARCRALPHAVLPNMLPHAPFRASEATLHKRRHSCHRVRALEQQSATGDRLHRHVVSSERCRCALQRGVLEGDGLVLRGIQRLPLGSEGMDLLGRLPGGIDDRQTLMRLRKRPRRALFALIPQAT